MHGLRASLSACPFAIFNLLSAFHFPQTHTASTNPLSNLSRQPHLLPPTSLQEYCPSKRSNSDSTIPHCQSTMRSLQFHTIILFTVTLPLLTTSIPTTNANQTMTTSTTTNHPAALAQLPTSILPHALAADACPTPPTEFLPYAPPPGYTPAPGCPPASDGTQPSEGDPPAGFYGASGTGSGSGSSGSTSSAEASGAGDWRGRGAVGRVLLVMLGWWGLKVCVCSGSG